MLTLSNFETEVDAKIVDRGLAYFESGAVADLDVDDIEWTAVVYGSDTYMVEATIRGDEVLATYCDCPYEWGDTCKHVVAMLYAIRAQQKKSTTSKKQKPQNKRKQVQALLEAQDKAELVNIILEQTKSNQNLLNQLLMKYDPQPAGEDLYIDMIRRWAKAKSDRGFLDYSGSRSVGRDTQRLVGQASSMIEQEDLDRALPIIRAVVIAVHEIMHSADDSSGDLGGALDMAFNTLEDSIVVIKSQGRDAEIFAYCLEGGMNPAYRYIDYDWRFLWIAAELVDNANRRDQLFAVLDGKVASLGYGGFTRYRQEDAVQIKQQVLEALDADPAEIDKLLQDNIHLHRIRKYLIDKHMNNKAYTEAVTLANDGVVQATNDGYPGLVTDYRKTLLMVAEATGDMSVMRELAEQMFFEGRDKMETFNKLKAYVPENEWIMYRQGLINRLKDNKRNAHYLLPMIYEAEGMWDDLFVWARQSRDIRMIVRYFDPFAAHFPERLADIFEQHVYKMLEHGKSRSVYQEAVNYLRYLIRVDSEERALQIADDLKAMYPTRRAMIDELSKL